MLTIQENGLAHRALKLALLAVVVLVVVWIPTKEPASTIGQATDAFVLIIAALSLNLVFGYTGLLSIGHSAFFGLGAYATAILVAEHGWGHGWTFFAAAAIAFVVGCLVALPALRIKGVYLALVTLAVAVLFPTLVRWQKLEWLTEGPRGISGVRYEELPEWPFLGELRGREGRAVFAYWLAFIIVVITFLVCRGIVRSRVGRALVAIRDNETAAAVMGVNLAATKTIVFGISAALTALAGSLNTSRTGVVTPDTVYATLVGAIVFLLVMLVGGAGTLAGPIIGAVAYVWLDNYTRDASTEGEGLIGWLFGWADTSPATFILGVALIVVTFVAPRGLIGLLHAIGRRIVRVVPRPVGVDAPARGEATTLPGDTAPAVEGKGIT